MSVSDWQGLVDATAEAQDVIQKAMPKGFDASPEHLQAMQAHCQRQGLLAMGFRDVIAELGAIRAALGCPRAKVDPSDVQE